MEKETKEVVESKGSEVSAEVKDMGLADEITLEDCSLGRLTLVQTNSDLVKEGMTELIQKFIDINDPSRILGDKEHPMEFIICSHIKYWVENDADTREFLGKYPAVNKHECKWSEVKEGRNIKRTYNFSYLVILPEDVKDGVLMPYEFAFRSTSLKVAERINMICKRMASQTNPIPTWGKVFKATSKTESKGSDSWFAPQVSLSRDATDVEKEFAMDMRNQLMSLRSSILQESQDGATASGAKGSGHGARQTSTEF